MGYAGCRQVEKNRLEEHTKAINIVKHRPNVSNFLVSSHSLMVDGGTCSVEKQLGIILQFKEAPTPYMSCDATDFSCSMTLRDD